MTTSQTKRRLKGVLAYAGIIGITLLLVDAFSIAFGLFPPTHNFGDQQLGWRPAPATGIWQTDQCTERSSGQTVRYQRNEDGVRTTLSRDSIGVDTAGVRIGITGDSQTDLCASNSELHAGVLQSVLTDNGVSTLTLTYGSGRYSPLQDYLAFRTVLKPYHPEVLILNLYTGNDFYDILRADDRPHFVKVDSGYQIADPVWYSLDNPTLRQRSRVLFAARALADKVGVRQLYFRLSELRRLGAEQGEGMGAVVAYMYDLWKARDPSVGYSDAYTAQFLNQQLFFYHFPGSEEESLTRVRALMNLVRGENPGLLLVMSPLPSYELTGEQPVDRALVETLKRLPIGYDEGVQQEGALYERLRSLAVEQGWIFVDNLSALREYRGPDRLYNDFDYHLLPSASAIIGRTQAAALLDSLRGRSR